MQCQGLRLAAGRTLSSVKTAGMLQEVAPV
ncbi:hypothetical protein ARSEF1564_009609 [Beauveria bassiana]